MADETITNPTEAAAAGARSRHALPAATAICCPATAATGFRTAADRARRTAATRATTTGAATAAATATAHRPVEGIWGDEYHSARQQRLPLSIELRLGLRRRSAASRCHFGGVTAE